MRDSTELHWPHLLDPTRIHRVEPSFLGAMFKEYQLSPTLISLIDHGIRKGKAQGCDARSLQLPLRFSSSKGCNGLSVLRHDHIYDCFRRSDVLVIRSDRDPMLSRAERESFCQLVAPFDVTFFAVDPNLQLFHPCGAVA